MTRFLRSLCCGVAALAASAVPTFPGEFFVAPAGIPRGDGSREHPWDLQTALSHPESVRPGDTIWLLGGVYRGGFTSRLSGAEGREITVRQAPGERATIDCREESRSALFVVDGEWVTFRGFEMTCSDPRRVTDKPGHGDLNRGGFHCRGSHVRFINLVVHDTLGAFGFWAEGAGGEIGGCVLYNNGWRGPDRAHGHAIYAQNQRGVKRLVDNVIFNQFGYGIHLYGSERAPLEGFQVEGNIAFDNGAAGNVNDRAPNIHVGGGSPASRIVLERNMTYHSVPGTSVRLGSGAENEDIAVRGNYWSGFTHLFGWKRMTVTDNTFVGRDSLVELGLATDEALSGLSWKRNQFVSRSQRYQPLTIRVRGGQTRYGWSEWQGLGLDRDGRYAQQETPEPQVFVRPNPYERGRAHVAVYNWTRQESVEVDLGAVLDSGQGFRIVAAHDIFGEPVVSGTFDNKPIHLPMTQRRAIPPIGLEHESLPTTQPEFGAFVVLAE